MILIVSAPEDVHARSVLSDIAADGGEAVIVDSSEFGNGAMMSHRVGDRRASSVTTRSGLRFTLDDVSAVWNRRQHRARPAAVVRDPADRRFATREWGDAIDGLLMTVGAEAVNPLPAQRAAVKPRQLEAARSAGLRVPDTLITADSEEGGRFVDEHDGLVIHKVLTAAEEGLADTRAWVPENRAALADLTFAPTIFQEYVPAAYDIRAIVIGPDILAMKSAVAAAAVDSRLDHDIAGEALTLPDSVADQLQRLMSSLGLVFGAIDLRITPEGEVVFFEVNPQGQFLYVEILTGLPVSATLARYLLRHEQR
jgi:glutathione synthase/RimK-type ligase-like ATP-grasp enzyme